MLTKDEARTRVARGVAHLDATRPDWYRHIDVGRLTMCESTHCIVGQLSGGHEHRFTQNALKLFPESPDPMFTCGAYWGVDFVMHHDLGPSFENPSRGDVYGWLQDLWIAAIADRLTASAPEPDAVNQQVGK